MIPVVQVSGGIPEAIAAERVFLNGFAFKLNMPHVRKFFSLSGVPMPHNTECTVRIGKETHPKSLTPCKPLPRRRSPDRVRAAVRLPKHRSPNCTFHRICVAMQFRGKDKVSKHGLRLLYVVRNPELLRAVVQYVTGNIFGVRRNLAMKHLRRRYKHLKMQMPLGSCAVRLPWCLHEGNIPSTKSVLQQFVLQLFWNHHFQAGLFTRGKLKLKISWVPVPSVLQLIRTAHKYNRDLDSESECACICSKPEFANFPRKLGHVCARQSEIPWPEHEAHLRNLPVQTRVVPDIQWGSMRLTKSLSQLAERIRDPFSTIDCQRKADETCQQFVTEILREWGLSGDGLERPLPGHLITMMHVQTIRTLCKGLFIDVLDKNPSAFGATCPYLVRKLAAGIFEYPLVHAVGGPTFRYDELRKSWPLSLDVLNNEHKAIVRSMRGTRPLTWTPVRILQKHKDLLRVRPLGDQSACPTALLFRLVARCIELCCFMSF